MENWSIERRVGSTEEATNQSIKLFEASQDGSFMDICGGMLVSGHRQKEAIIA